MAHSVQLTKAAQRELKKLAKKNRELATELFAAIYGLEDEPRPAGHKKLSGEDDLYRMRVGDYRIVYQLRGHELVILIVRVGHRREIYQAKF